jgi:hypothetical protein
MMWFGELRLDNLVKEQQNSRQLDQNYCSKALYIKGLAIEKQGRTVIYDDTVQLYTLHWVDLFTVIVNVNRSV